MRCTVVDPAQAAPVLQLASARHLTVESILLTHGHYDHTAGVPEVVRAHSARVFAPAGCKLEIPSETVKEGDVLTIGPYSLGVISTPGHTAHDTSYLDTSRGLLFCGDTLFGGGCGRPFECPPETLWASLQRLALLPDATRVFCGHEYTVSNLQFALAQLGAHPAIGKRLQDAVHLRELGLPTIPSTLGLEKETNLYLLAGSPAIRKALGMAGATPLAVFRELRERKNRA
ncbi:MAG: hydroxyacylglutathione hydrolase [Kiritimatiellia bacterium]